MSDRDAAAGAAPAPGGEAAASANDAPRKDGIAALLADVHGLAHDQLGLLALEARRAGISLVAILAWGILASVMLVLAWLLAQSAALLALLERGVPASVALAALAAFNGVGAFLLAREIRRRSADLAFPATRRSLAPLPSAAPPAAK